MLNKLRTSAAKAKVEVKDRKDAQQVRVKYSADAQYATRKAAPSLAVYGD